MAGNKSYRLLCPIARALDQLGDRWSLLILRDLHAGPARFGDLQSALPGLASNLLSSRLEALQRDGLVLRAKGTYELTAAGEGTAPLLFELAAFGSRSPVPTEVRRPGNLRTVAVSMKEGLRRVVELDTAMDVELVVDGEAFAIDIAGGQVTVRYGASAGAALSLETDYESMIAVGDTRMSASDFGKNHVVVARGTRKAARGFLSLMAAAFSQ